MPVIRYSRRPEIEAAPMQDETVLFHPGTKRFMLLNGAAAHLWAQLEQPRSADELAQGLVEAFDGVDPAVALRDTEATLRQFLDLDMVASQKS